MQPVDEPGRGLIGLFDSHVHFDAAEFFPMLDEAAWAARSAGCIGAVNPAIDLASSRKTLEIHGRHPWILPALGIHPLYLEDAGSPKVALTGLEALAAGGRYAAVGEVGLDFWRGRQDEARQRDFLYLQAALAQRLGLPLLLHVRRAFYEAFSVLHGAGFAGEGVAHAFGGSRDMARLALDRGFYLSACAVITRPSAEKLREVFRWAPKDRILVETDAPDIPPWTKRGQPHRPEDLPITVDALARALGLPFAETARLTAENARRLFKSRAP